MNNIKPMDNIWIIPLNEKRLVVVSIEIPQSGYLVPAVDFNNLQEVLIITEMKNQ